MGSCTVKTVKSARSSVGHYKVHIRHQKKPDSWKGKATTPVSDEFMTEVRKECHILIQKINARLVIYFAVSTIYCNCYQS